MKNKTFDTIKMDLQTEISFLKMIPEACMFLVTFIPLRQNAGGYHTKHRWSCAVMSLLIYIAVLLSVRLCQINQFIQIMLFVVNMLVIIRLAPVDNIDNRLDDDEIRVYKNRTRNILVVELVIFMIFFICNCLHWCYIITMSVMVTGILVCIGTFQNKTTRG